MGRIATDQECSTVVREPGGRIGSQLGALFEVGSPSALTDGQLLERFATRPGVGAEQAFEALIGRHGPMVLRACRAILRDDHEAMDAFQATFLVLASKGRSLWVGDSLGPWLHRVACRAASRARAGAARRRAIERRLAGSIAEAIPDPPRDDLAAILHEELDRLPERYRAAIVLCDLQGHTCEETARRLGCPIGTVGSRLSRGRERLRSRLIRRGLAPMSGLIPPTFAASIPTPLATATLRGVLASMTTRATAGVSSAAVASLAEDVSRSLIMAKVRSAASALAVACGVALVAGPALLAVALAQEPAEVKAKAQGKPAADPKAAPSPAAGEPVRRDWVTMAIAGFPAIDSLHPHSDDPVRANDFVRVAILHKDGTIELRSLPPFEDPNRADDRKWLLVVPPLRGPKPFRNCDFIEEARLLLATTADSIKLWDGVTGAPRKEIAGQFMNPAEHPGDDRTGRFQTIDLEGRVVTTWDGKTLEPVASFKAGGPSRVVAAAQSRDGRAIVTIGEDRSATLRRAPDGRPIATFAPGSPLARMALRQRDKDSPTNGISDGFWIGVRHLLPADGVEPAGK